MTELKRNPPFNSLNKAVVPLTLLNLKSFLFKLLQYLRSNLQGMGLAFLFTYPFCLSPDGGLSLLALVRRNASSINICLGSSFPLCDRTLCCPEP